jgi:hypothetical protein
MLDLVEQETERIESRFLEPACGNGNFLVEVLRRKLNVVDARYRRKQYEWERNAITAVSSLYGIDILEDNCRECRDRLFRLADEHYTRRFKSKAKEPFRDSIRYLLETNIIWGDALTLCTVGEPNRPIVFAEWSPVNGSFFKRRDYEFRELLATDEPDTGANLFDSRPRKHRSDTGQSVFIPRPVRDYPLVHFLEIGHAYR